MSQQVWASSFIAFAPVMLNWKCREKVAILLLRVSHEIHEVIKRKKLSAIKNMDQGNNPQNDDLVKKHPKQRSASDRPKIAIETGNLARKKLAQVSAKV
jgi:hypothetical protein